MITSTRPHPASSGSVEPPASAANVDAAPQTEEHAILAATEDWIKKHPIICVGAALTMGVLLGCLIKRR